MHAPGTGFRGPMNVQSLRRRFDALARGASEEEMRPPLVTIGLPFAGVLPLGEHRRGAALLKVMPVEEYRRDLSQILAPVDVERGLELGMQQEEGELARLIAIHIEILGMSKEQCATKLSELKLAGPDETAQEAERGDTPQSRA